jgi:hypothetical protein
MDHQRLVSLDRMAILRIAVAAQTGARAATSQRPDMPTRNRRIDLGNSQSATSLDVQEFTSAAGSSTAWSVDGTGMPRTRPAAAFPTHERQPRLGGG